MIALIVVTAQTVESMGDVPWWAYLIVVPFVGLVIAYLRKVLRLEDDRPATGSASPPQVPAPPTVTQVPQSADAQLEMAKQLVAELVRDRDETKSELREARATVTRLEARGRDQDATIARLQQMLGMYPPGPPAHG